MRRLAKAAAVASLALGPVLAMPMAAQAEGAPIIPTTPAPPPVPMAVWTFTGNWSTLQACNEEGQALHQAVPEQNRRWQCEATNASPTTWDLWVLFINGGGF